MWRRTFDSARFRSFHIIEYQPNSFVMFSLLLVSISLSLVGRVGSGSGIYYEVIVANLGCYDILVDQHILNCHLIPDAYLSRKEGLEFCLRRCNFGDRQTFFLSGNSCFCTSWLRYDAFRIFPMHPSQIDCNQEFLHCRESHPKSSLVTVYSQHRCTDLAYGHPTNDHKICEVGKDDFTVLFKCANVWPCVNSHCSQNASFSSFHFQLTNNSPENCMNECLRNGLELDPSNHDTIITLGDTVDMTHGLITNCGCNLIPKESGFPWNTTEEVDSLYCTWCPGSDCSGLENTTIYCGGQLYLGGVFSSYLSIYKYSGSERPDKCQSTTTARTTSNPLPCPDGAGETKLHHPGSCTKYYICLNGEFLNYGYCAPTTWFDFASQVCVFKEDSDCLQYVTLPTSSTPQLTPSTTTAAVGTSSVPGDDGFVTVTIGTLEDMQETDHVIQYYTYYKQWEWEGLKLDSESETVPNSTAGCLRSGVWKFNATLGNGAIILVKLKNIVVEVSILYYSTEDVWCYIKDFGEESEGPTLVELPGTNGTWTTHIFPIHRTFVSEDPIYFTLDFANGAEDKVFLLDSISYTSLSSAPGIPTTTEETSPSTTEVAATTDAYKVTSSSTTEVETTTDVYKVTSSSTIEVATTTDLPTTTPEHSTTDEEPKITTGEPTKPFTSTTKPLPVVCQGENKVRCSAKDRAGNHWEGCAGDIVTQSCKDNSTGDETWECLPSGEFKGPNPDITECLSYWILDIGTYIESYEGVEASPLPIQAAEHIVRVIQKKCNASKESNGTLRQYYGHEIKTIFQLGRKTLKLVGPETETQLFEALTLKALVALGDVFTHQEPWKELSAHNVSETGSTFISAMEESSLELTSRISKNSSFVEQGKYQNNYINRDHLFEVGCGAQVKSEAESEGLSYPFRYSEEKDSYIQLPSDWANYFSDQDVKYVGMQIQSAYVNQIFPGNLSIDGRGSSEGEKLVNGNLLSFSFDSTTLRSANLNFTENNGVRITFRHDVEAWGSEKREIQRKLHAGERPKAVLGSSACVFWDPETLAWSSEGCKLIESTRTSTVCECYHLTSFALLMDVHQYIGKQLALEVLTWILSPLSIAGLAICIFVFSTSIKSGRTPRNEITNHLCIWLLVGNVLLLLFMDRNYFHIGDGLCMTVGILLHYSFLVAFMWNSVEGFQLYQMIIVVFDDGKDYIVIQRILAYGLPALIIGITAGVGAAKSEPAYGGDALCWLEEDYIWAFLGPVAVVILINLSLLIFCLNKAYSLNRNPRILQMKRKEKSFLSWAKGASSLCVLLGVTWIFGFLMLSPVTAIVTFAAYLFTILNASQGILLFVFHCWMNQHARDSLTRRFPKWVRLSNIQSLKTGFTDTSSRSF